MARWPYPSLLVDTVTSKTASPAWRQGYQEGRIGVGFHPAADHLSGFLVIRMFLKISIHITALAKRTLPRAGPAAAIILALLQAEIGDVVWYMQSLSPQFVEARHEETGLRVKCLRSPWMHRLLWRVFYLTPGAWRWRRFFRPLP